MFKLILLLLSCTLVWSHTVQCRAKPKSDSHSIQLCTEKQLPSELQEQADDLAVQINPLNGPHKNTTDDEIRPLLALPIGSMWATGTNLRVKILNGTPTIQQKIRDIASQWPQYGNIAFTFVDDGDAEIRINVDDSGASWSYVGTDNLMLSQDQPTMNFGWLTDESAESEFERVILHEFGHAIGCAHEHQSPSAEGIPWNKPAVYSYYLETAGWDQAEVDNQVFALYDASSTQFTAFDPASIMLYAIPAELTTNGYHTEWNTQLSDTDKSFIGQTYPF